MASVSEKRKGSLLFIEGIDISVPAEYITDSSMRDSQNFEISRGIITKRDGMTQLVIRLAG
jgi:hypothetical protein